MVALFRPCSGFSVGYDAFTYRENTMVMMAFSVKAALGFKSFQSEALFFS